MWSGVFGEGEVKPKGGELRPRLGDVWRTSVSAGSFCRAKGDALRRCCRGLLTHRWKGTEMDYCHWQMKIRWTGGGQRAKWMPPWRSGQLRPAVAGCWLGCQHGRGAACSSAHVRLLVRVHGEKVTVLAGGVGESLWCGDVRRFGRGMLEGQDGITGDVRELGWQGWLHGEGHPTWIRWQQ